MSYLGHIISAAGVKTDESKINKIKGYPVPKYEVELISFLGFCGYYRKFIKNYATLVQPLEAICKKKTTQSNIIWNDTALYHLRKLKEALVTAPILSFVVKGANSRW